MANPKLATLNDGFTGTSINTGLWNSITGTATLDATNDLVTLAQPTVNGTTNSFGSTNVYDATSSSIYAEVGPSANGSGFTGTLFKISKDANNWIAIRLLSGVFTVGLTTAGTTVSTALPSFDPNAFGWWEIAENGAGSFVISTSPDGFNWTVQATLAYTWAATAVTFAFQATTSGTEVSGNVATIQHVNTMQGGIFNINWPILEEAWGAYWGTNGGDVDLDRYVEITNRTRQQSSVSRGKQYEVDQVRSGEAALELVNTDGALDPLNTSGPFYGNIKPYQPYRKRAQWPPTRNLLAQVIATAGDLGGYSAGAIPGGSGGIDLFTDTDPSGGSITASSSAWQGGSVFQFSVPSGTAASTRVCYTLQNAAENGTTYTASMWVRNVTASTSLQVKPALGLYTAGSTTPTSFVYGSTVTLTGSTTAAWTQVTVSTTIPAGAMGVMSGVAVAATAGATVNVQVDGWQFEKASVASSWCCPGVWYGWFGGFFERWPSSWDMGGTYGTVQPTGVDAMALLSQVTLSDPLTQEINSRTPRFVYTLGDPSNSTYAADLTGQQRPAPLGVSKYGAGSLTFGNQITSVTSGGVYTGSTDTVVTLANANPGTNLTPSAATFISLSSAGIVGPASVTGTWSRMIAFRYTNGSVPAQKAVMWSCLDNKSGGGSQILFMINNAGYFEVDVAGPNGTVYQFVPTSAISVADGNWHLAIASFTASGTGSMYVSIDNIGGGFGSLPTTMEPTGLTSDAVGAYVDPSVGGGTIYNWKGDISFACEFPGALSGSDTTALYNAWKSAFTGDSTNARYARILGYAGYTGLSSLQTGQTTSMGAMATDGQDALSALQAVVDTENGQHFVDPAGVVTFQSRAARYNATTPVYTFGENTSAGEWPYEDCQLDYDPTHLGNIVQVTQSSTNQVFTGQDTTSQLEYFPRTMTRTVNASSPLECQDAANYLLSRYKQPATRISSVVLHPSANPAMWPVAFSLALGMRIRVNRRPPSAPEITVDCFVENLQWTNDDGGEAFLTIQCSPVDLTPYGLFASFHTTLNATIAANVGSFVINAGADNTNPAAAQIGYGQQLVLGLGTANQETVTVKSVSTTTSGWSTATITLQANTVNSHTSGVTVCEPLPSGVTSASTYDNSAKFDSIAFSY